MSIFQEVYDILSIKSGRDMTAQEAEAVAGAIYLLSLRSEYMSLPIGIGLLQAEKEMKAGGER